MPRLSKEQIEEIRDVRTRGHLRLADWGPRCHGCGEEEFRIDGYCTIECRDYHSDEDIGILTDECLRLLDGNMRYAERVTILEGWKRAMTSELGVLRRVDL